MNASNSTLPNPIVYLNYLPPDVASDYELSQSIYIVTLGAIIWDMLSPLPQDWKLLRNSKVTPPYVAYHTSRFFALAYVVLYITSRAGSAPQCQAAQTAICACIFLTNIASDFLFLARVRAVYHSSKRVRWIFVFLWFLDAGVMSLIFLGIHANNIGDTTYCIDNGGYNFFAVTMFMPFFFDTMVFIFITVKLMSVQYPTEKLDYRTLLSGKTLPRLSRTILISGQQYYLIRICCSMLITTLWLAHSVSTVLQPTLTIPTIAVTSSMACRVYRNLRLQLFDDGSPEVTVSDRSPKLIGEVKPSTEQGGA